MNDSATMVRLLGSIRDHLNTFPLMAKIASVKVDYDEFDGEHITVHLWTLRLCPLACALLEWADTLTAITVTAWRPPHGQSVHMTLSGLLPDKTPVQVYSGVDYSDRVFGDLQQGGRQAVALSILRGWAAGGQAVAA